MRFDIADAGAYVAHSLPQFLGRHAELVGPVLEVPMLGRVEAVIPMPLYFSRSFAHVPSSSNRHAGKNECGDAASTGARLSAGRCRPRR